MRGRKSLIVVSTAALAATLLSSPAAAAGGGCVDVEKANWNIGICLSKNKTTIFGDIYINARGFTGSSCSVTRWLVRYHLKSKTNEKVKRTDSCAIGHKSNISMPRVASKLYRQIVTVKVNGNIVFTGHGNLGG